jgi:parallel beta-helix repeat protein
MGDASAETAYFTATVNQISSLNPALVLFNGDLENNGFVLSEINPMISALKSANLFNKTYLVRGNADDHVSGSAALWESYFETAPNIKVPPTYVTNHVALNSSSDNLVYSFEYGNSIFIGLDVPGDIEYLTTEQMNFLDARLTYAESQGLTHAFIFFHGPEYPVESVHSTCSTRADANCTPPSLVTIINNHPIVSATFHGHEQVLSWTHMDSTRVAGLTRSYEEFITSPSGGSTYNQYIYPERVDYFYPDMDSSQGFATISVNGLSFTYNIYKTGTTQPVYSHTFSKVNTAPTISNITDKTINEDVATGSIPFTVGDVETNTNYLTVTASSSDTNLVPDENISLGGSGANRTLNITPAPNQSGTATITVSVNDGNVTTNDTFLLTVNAVNDAPVAIAQSVSMSWNTSINITLAGTDVEASPLTYSIVSNPAHGSLSGSGANQTYTSATNYSGPDSFTFKVNDGTLDSAPATVSIDVTAHTISGNAGIAGATLSYTDGTSKTVTADGTGLYTFQVPTDWSGTVTPSKDGYIFSPASMTYANVLADQATQNYTAAIVTFIISGNAGHAGVTLSYTDGTLKTVTADSTGLYTIEVPYNWSGTVTPSLSGYGFFPATRTYTNLTSNQASQDYSASTGSIFYVDKTNAACTDTGTVGSLALPFCTIGRAAYLAVAGQTVHVLHGSYAETVTPRNSGTAGNPITYWADSGVTVTGQPQLTVSPFTAYPGFAISTKSYLVITGFNVTQTGMQGIYADSSDHLTISNNHVSYSGVTSTTHPYEQGIYLKTTTYSTISGNIADHNTCIGIRLLNNSNNNLVSNNISFSNYSVIETDAAGIETTGSSYNTIIDNITYSNEDSGINIYVNSSTKVQSTYNLVIDNLSYENGDHGIDTNNSPYNTYIGNTVHGNGTTGINVEGEATTGSHHTTLVNNISAGNGFAPPAGSFGGDLRVDSASVTGTTADYDLFNREDATVQIIWNDVNYTSLAALHADVPTQEVHGLEGDPRFVTPITSVVRHTGVPYVGTGIVGNYYLNPGSPAIDSANADAPSQPLSDIQGNARMDDPSIPNTGAGVRTFDDRGAYEYLPSGTSLAALTTQAATAITTTTATGNGNITALGAPNPDQHGVVWSTSANPTTDDNKTTDGPVSAIGAFTSNITGLTAGTLYHVRAYATNAAGTSYGDDVSFTTLLVPTVTTQAVTAITATTATGNGNITVLGIPNPTQHGVVWGTSANPTTTGNKTVDGAVSATGAFTSSITGLTAGTLYHVRAYATNTAGTVYGDDVTFTSLNTPVVTTQAVTAIAAVTATGNGNITSLGIPNPSQHGVVWGTSLNPTTANSKTIDGPVSAAGAFTSSMTGLTPGTLYHVRAYATNTAGTAYGEDVTFTTLIAPTVTTQAVSAITTTTATGNGNITALGSSNPTEHGVVWSTVINPTTADSKTTDGPISATGAFTSSITGLTPGTLYHVRAYATNVAGTSYGEDVTFTAFIAPTVTTQAVTSIGTTTATGNGNITALGVPNPTQHGVVWSTSANPTIVDSKTTDGAVSASGAFTSSLSGLAPGMPYHVRAYATNAVNTVYGADVTFTTLPLSNSTTTPATNARTGSDVTGTGTITWLNPGYIITDDTNYATVTLSGATSHYLTGSNYGFAIPANATINGIVVTIGRFESGAGTGADVTDSTVKLMKAGVLTGNNKASAAEWPTGSPTAAVYGTTADLWGTTWTPADINASNFGVGLSASSTNNRMASVDYMQISVTYTVTVISSSTTINCGAGSPVVTYGSSLVCVATVAQSSGSLIPTGNVTWTTNGSGSFVTSPCVLSTSSGTASCSVTYNPSSVGSGLHLITATYAGDTGFISSNGTQTVTVNKKAATLALTPASKTYGDLDPVLNGSLAGFLTADNVTATYSRAAGETVAGGPYTISAVLNPAGVLANYTITITPAVFTINKKAATVTLTAASKTYGDVDPTLSGSIAGFLPADNVTATYSRAAGETVAGGPYAISAVLNPAGVLANYTITTNPAVFTINKKAASVTLAAASKTYGEVDPTLTGTLTGFVPADNVTATFTRAAGETVAGGPYAISAVLSPASVLPNYTVTTNSANFTINKKAASVTPAAASKTYGDVDPNLTGALIGFVPADNVTATYTRAAGETVAGGPYVISATLSPAAVLANYNVTTSTASFTINKKTASVTPTAASKAYGDADPTLTGILTGFVPADNVTATYSRTAGETIAGSPYTISAVLSPAGILANYTITNNTAVFTITKRNASVTPNAASKTYGSADPTLTGVLTGFVPADGVTATYSRAAGETVAGGPYAISAVLSPAGVLANYNITMNSAAFTINKKAASVTLTAASKTYGTVDPTLTGVLTGFVPADGVTATYSRAAGETVAGGPYTISAVLSPADVLANYTITTTPAVFTINKKAATVTLTAASKTYGEVDPTLSGSIAGFVPADGVTATYTRAAGETVAGGPYAISAVLSPAGVLPNYNITTNSAVFTINKKAASATPNAATKPWGASDPTLTGSIAGFLPADNVTATFTRTAGETIEGSPYTISAVLSPVGVLPNYNITYNTANFTITVPLDEYTLTLAEVGNGTVTANPNNPHYHYGDVVTLTATPDAGWSFGSWSANVVSGKITMHGNTTVTATFTQDEYTLTLTKVGNGTVTANPNNLHYHYGDVVTLTATPDTGWSFGSWSANATGGTITIHGNITVTATFTQDEYTLTLDKVGHGTVTASPNNLHYHYEDVVTLTATPDPDWNFGSWSANVVAGKVTIHGNTTVTATFIAIVYNTTLTAAPAAGAYGDKINLSATLTKTTDGTAVAGKAINFRLNGNAVGSAATNASGVAVLNAVSLDGIAVGEYPGVVSASFVGDDNFTISTATADLSVTKRAVSVTADAKTKHIGEADPVLTYQITNGSLVGTDAFSGALVRDPGEALGSYAIKQGTLALSNSYELTYVGANLTITPPPDPTITGNAGVGGAVLSYTGGSPVTAAPDGSYTITVHRGWTGTVTPSKASYAFTPVSKPYTNVQTNQTGQNYTAKLLKPVIPTTVSPNGTITTTGPTYVWKAVAGAASYRLSVINQSKNSYVINNMTVPATVCKGSPSVCSFHPATVLGTYTYKFGVAAVNAAGNSGFAPLASWRVFTVRKLATFTSDAAQDGYLLESTETSGIGGMLNAITPVLYVGDSAKKQQYRSILSFNTASLPDNAVIVSATLKLKKQTEGGVNSLNTLGALLIDIKSSNFGASPVLQLDDFAALAGLNNAGTVGKTPVNGLYVANLGTPAFNQVNKIGSTQLRLRFALDDDNDVVADWLAFFSGNAPIAANRPVLEITYYVP